MIGAVAAVAAAVEIAVVAVVAIVACLDYQITIKRRLASVERKEDEGVAADVYSA